MNEQSKALAEGSVLQIRKIGNSVGLILPKDMLARLHLKEGDKLHVVDQTDRGFRLTPSDPTFDRGMEIARRGMRIYKNALTELAK